MRKKTHLSVEIGSDGVKNLLLQQWQVLPQWNSPLATKINGIHHLQKTSSAPLISPFATFLLDSASRATNATFGLNTCWVNEESWPCKFQQFLVYVARGIFEFIY